MKEQGVKASILHPNVLSTRSSILCIVLASNTNLGSPTCHERIFRRGSNEQGQSHQQQALLSLKKKKRRTCQIANPTVSISFIPVNLLTEALSSPPFWLLVTNKLQLTTAHTNFYLSIQPGKMTNTYQG